MTWCLVFALVATRCATADYLSETWQTALAQDTASRSLHGEFIQVPVGDAQRAMQVYIAKPEGNTPKPAVIVAHHAVGIYHREFMRQFADDLTEHGYVAVVPDFFHRVWSDDTPTGLGMDFEKMNIMNMLNSMEDAKTLQDVETALGVLESMPDVDSKRIGILGFCLGGRISWLAAVEPSFRGRINAAVPYHGGNVFKAKGEGAIAPGDKIKDGLHCPVLGHFGALDGNPSPSDMQRLQELAGSKLETKVYEGAEHGFSCKDSAKYVEEAASAAWASTLSFLQRALAPRKSDDQQEL